MSNPVGHRLSRTFIPLEQTAFQSLEQGAYLKGLLKPFKGKSELEAWAKDCEHLRDQLIELGKNKILAQVKAYPFALLPIRLVSQTTGNGTLFLRWCNPKRTVMGSQLWDAVIADLKTPVNLLDDLYALEQQRITFNMQVSLLHTLRRQALECAEKMEQAREAIKARVQ